MTDDQETLAEIIADLRSSPVLSQNKHVMRICDELERRLDQLIKKDLERA